MSIRSMVSQTVRSQLSAPRWLPGLAALLSSVPAAAFSIVIPSGEFVVTPVFSNVPFFSIRIEVEAPLQSGIYDNPVISTVEYQVTGTLAPGTPSGFPAFDLRRTITGTDFYGQGSSLKFEIASNAVLSDGLQVAELVGNGVVFTFNGREIDNGRYHPALLELNSNGTGTIRNSNNIPTLDPLVQVAFGAEYITDLDFDPGNLTIVGPPTGLGSGTGAMSAPVLALLLLAGLCRRRSMAPPGPTGQAASRGAGETRCSPER